MSESEQFNKFCDELEGNVDSRLERFENQLGKQLWNWTNLLSRMLMPFMNNVEALKAENAVLKDEIQLLKRAIVSLTRRVNNELGEEE